MSGVPKLKSLIKNMKLSNKNFSPKKEAMWKLIRQYYKKMSTFPGSSFFSDTEFLKRRAFLSSHYNIPLFIYSKLTRPKNYNQRNKTFLRKQLRRYTKIYNQSVKLREAKESDSISNKKQLWKSYYERPKKSEFITPAANRYKIKGTDIAAISKKQTGTKGPYKCFTGVRDKSSYYGHMIEVVGYTPISKNFYYDLPAEMELLNHPRNHFVMKIRKGSREKQRTYMRSMLNDLSLCPKDPKFPGPDKYFPQNFLIREKACNRTKKDKSRIFHPGAYIPESERFVSNKPSLPGPGRYSPQIVARPCKCGSEYLEKAAKAAEYQKWKYSPFYSKTHRVKSSTCEAPNLRNIPGQGFSSVFKSATKRLIAKPTLSQKESSKNDPRSNEKFPMILDPQYVRLISQPRRQTLSIRIDAVKPTEPLDIKFNTTAKIMPRQKIRTNKAVAFMSSCPRFEGGGGKATFLANRNMSKKSTSSETVNQVNIVRFATNEGTERLVKLPPRYEEMKSEKGGNDKLGNLFQHLPKAKILLKQVNFQLN